MKDSNRYSCKFFAGAIAALCVACGASAAPVEWFSAIFKDYAVGTALSNDGLTNLQLQQSDVAPVCAFDGTRNSFAVNDGAVEFAPDPAAAQSNFRVVDFCVSAKDLPPFNSVLELTDATAALTPALLDGSVAGFAGLTADGLVALRHESVSPAAGGWIEGRIELKSSGGAWFAGYSVKAGDEYVRLADASGTEWFRVRAPKAEEGVSTIEFQGEGRFSDFSGRQDAIKFGIYRWKGDVAVGAWNDAANWTFDGSPAESAPGAAGDIAVVDGEAEIDGVAVSGITIGFGENGEARLMGGAIEGVSVDLSRPRAGVELKAETPELLGISPEYSYEWLRGDVSGEYETTPVSNTASFTPSAADYEHWFKFVARRAAGTVAFEKKFFFSKLPVLYMTTDDGETPTAEKEKHDGRVFVQGNDEWKSLYDGKMTINVRGNSTKGYPKKPWKLKLDKKTAMFGIPKSKHWVLLANYLDHSMLRNKLAYDFASDIGVLAMKSTWVECVLNGEWQGTYQFCEHVRVDKDRVNVHDWEGDAGDIAEAFAKSNGLDGDQEDALAAQLEQDLSWVTTDSFTFKSGDATLAGKPSELLGKDFTDDISGGYLFESSQEYDELSKFTLSTNLLSANLEVKMMVKTPEYLFTNTNMMEWCQKFMQGYWTACTSIDGYSTDPLTGEEKYIGDYCDIDSMVNYWLVVELFGNSDAGHNSRYMYKEQGKKLVFGPVWDFDWAMAGINLTDISPERWYCQTCNDPKYKYAPFYKEWTDNPEFSVRLHTRYWQVRDRFAQCFAAGGEIDAATNYLVEACHANSARWPRYYNNGAQAFDSDVARIKNFLEKRLAWLDEQFRDVPTLMASLEEAASVKPTHPYEKAETALPIAFSGLSGGAARRDRPFTVSTSPSDVQAASVSFFVNGVRIAEKLAPAGGTFSATVPAPAMTAPDGEPNCIAAIAYDASGNVVARNYELLGAKKAKGAVMILK